MAMLAIQQEQPEAEALPEYSPFPQPAPQPRTCTTAEDFACRARDQSTCWVSGVNWTAGAWLTVVRVLGSHLEHCIRRFAEVALPWSDTWSAISRTDSLVGLCRTSSTTDCRARTCARRDLRAWCRHYALRTSSSTWRLLHVRPFWTCDLVQTKGGKTG